MAVVGEERPQEGEEWDGGEEDDDSTEVASESSEDVTYTKGMCTNVKQDSGRIFVFAEGETCTCLPEDVAEHHFPVLVCCEMFCYISKIKLHQ